MKPSIPWPAAMMSPVRTRGRPMNGRLSGGERAEADPGRLLLQRDRRGEDGAGAGDDRLVAPPIEARVEAVSSSVPAKRTRSRERG